MITKSGKWFRQAAIATACILPLWSHSAFAERIKDLASIQGVRSNQLIGYGIVAGLDNTGDQTTQTPFTTQAIGNMLSQMGVNLTQEQALKLQLKNVAAVMITTSLPPFAKPGQPIDVTVSSLGNAKSLRGGTLLMTQLKGADGQVYAVAQGNVLVGGAQQAVDGGHAAIVAAGRFSKKQEVSKAPVVVEAGPGQRLSLKNKAAVGGRQRRQGFVISDMKPVGSNLSVFPVECRRNTCHLFMQCFFILHFTRRAM